MAYILQGDGADQRGFGLGTRETDIFSWGERSQQGGWGGGKEGGREGGDAIGQVGVRSDSRTAVSGMSLKSEKWGRKASSQMLSGVVEGCMEWLHLPHPPVVGCGKPPPLLRPWRLGEGVAHHACLCCKPAPHTHMCLSLPHEFSGGGLGEGRGQWGLRIMSARKSSEFPSMPEKLANWGGGVSFSETKFPSQKLDLC